VHQRDALVLLVRALADERAVTTILVTHDRDEALALATDLVVLHDGQLVEHGSALQLLQQPATAFTAAFLLGAACLPVASNGTHVETAFGRFAGPGRARRSAPRRVARRGPRRSGHRGSDRPDRARARDDAGGRRLPRARGARGTARHRDGHDAAARRFDRTLVSLASGPSAAVATAFHLATIMNCAPASASSRSCSLRAAAPSRTCPAQVDEQHRGHAALADSAQCRECHQALYDEWKASHHSMAYTNPEVRAERRLPQGGVQGLPPAAPARGHRLRQTARCRATRSSTRA
jgi:hypothetical protein